MDRLNFERIGEKLRTIRLSKNLTQEYIAMAIKPHRVSSYPDG